MEGNEMGFEWVRDWVKGERGSPLYTPIYSNLLLNIYKYLVHSVLSVNWACFDGPNVEG